IVARDRIIPVPVPVLPRGQGQSRNQPRKATGLEFGAAQDLVAVLVPALPATLDLGQLRVNQLHYRVGKRTAPLWREQARHGQELVVAQLSVAVEIEQLEQPIDVWLIPGKRGDFGLIQEPIRAHVEFTKLAFRIATDRMEREFILVEPTVAVEI